MVQDDTYSAYLLTIEQAAHQLFYQSLTDPWSLLSPSIYETASVVKVSPAFQPNPEGSLLFLLDRQNANGSWGGPELYAIVPSLAATASILHVLLQRMKAERVPDDCDRIVQAAQRGVLFLASTLYPRMLENLPDTIAVELIVPALIEEIQDLLAGLAMIPQLCPERAQYPFWPHIQECLTIRLPEQEKKYLLQVRTYALKGEEVPPQISHCLEVLGKAAGCLSVPVVNGVVGCSPAATATMLAFSDGAQPASLMYLKETSARLGGALPSVSPIAQFERTWVIYAFLQARIPLSPTIIEAALAYCQPCLGPWGASAGDGLPADADDSAVMLSVLSMLGAPTAPNALLLYEKETSFCCFEGERTPSVSTNAHVLEAFCTYLQTVPSEVSVYQSAREKLTTYLISEQRPDGSWLDKWHASPFYATWCCVLALRDTPVPDVSMTLDRSVAWILKTQRGDGSWGLWHGTLEETAYALVILIAVGQGLERKVWQAAIEQGKCFLQKHLDAPLDDSVYAPLWHDKELYTPRRVVRAVVLDALYQCLTSLKR